MDEKEIKGWKDVQITPDMPVNVIINFLNILNQRLCAVENLTSTIGPDGKMISLTDLYAIQAAEEAKRQAEQQNQPEEPKE